MPRVIFLRLIDHWCDKCAACCAAWLTPWFWFNHQRHTQRTFLRQPGHFADKIFCQQTIGWQTVRRQRLWYPNQLSFFFSDWAETFFWPFLTSWTTKLPIAYMSVIVWFCYSFKYVSIFVSTYLPISAKFSTNIPHRRIFYPKFKFLRFLLTFLVVWDFAKFLRWSPYHVRIEILWGKSTFLGLFYRGVCCAIMSLFFR